MKSFIPLLAAAGLVAAQDYSGQPKCAVPCLNKAIPQVGCTLEDTGCQCNKDKQDQLVGIVAPCLIKSCGSSDLIKAQAAASAACAAYASTAGSGFLSTASASGSAESSVSIPTNHLLPPVPSSQTQTGGETAPTTTGSPATSADSSSASGDNTSAPSTPTKPVDSTPTAETTTAAPTPTAGAADLAAGGALLVFAAALAL